MKSTVRHQITTLFATAGLTARFIEHDQIEIYRGDEDTRITIQILGNFHVNEHRGEGSTRTLIPRGSFYTLCGAIACVLETIETRSVEVAP